MNWLAWYVALAVSAAWCTPEVLISRQACRGGVLADQAEAVDPIVEARARLEAAGWTIREPVDLERPAEEGIEIAIDELRQAFAEAREARLTARAAQMLRGAGFELIEPQRAAEELTREIFGTVPEPETPAEPETEPETTEPGEEETPAVDLDELTPPPIDVSQPEPQLAPPPPAYSGDQARLLQLTQARNSRLRASPALMSSAQAYANHMARTGRFAHSSRSWRGSASENIAWNGSGSVDRLGSQWMSSRGHRSNWLGSWNYVGVGVARSGGRVYGVQHFANNVTGSSGPITTTSSRNYTPQRRRGLLRRLFGGWR